jgi:hypothetical protein
MMDWPIIDFLFNIIVVSGLVVFLIIIRAIISRLLSYVHRPTTVGFLIVIWVIVISMI